AGNVQTTVQARAAREDARQIAGRDAEPRVLDGEHGRVCRGREPHAHGARSGRVLDRVADQVADDAAELAGVSLHRHRRALVGELELLVLRGKQVARDDLGDQLVQIERARNEPRYAAVDGGEIEVVRHQVPDRAQRAE